MNLPDSEPLVFRSPEEITLLTELLEAEHARLLVGIRHTFHRDYKDVLHRRLDLLEGMMKQASRSV